MNIKVITRAMELSDDDWELATKLRALSETERELLMTALGPQKPAARKSSKKAGKKSQRAQSLGDAIQRRPRGVVTGEDSGDDGRVPVNECSYELSYGPCQQGSDNNIHHLKAHPNFHPFQPAASSAPPPPSDQASSEIGKADVSSAAQGAGGGD